MKESEKQHIIRCIAIAKKAMIKHKYNLAFKLILKVPDPIGTKMFLLIMEHEAQYLKTQGKIV